MKQDYTDYHPLEGVVYGILLEALRTEVQSLVEKLVSGCVSTEEQDNIYEYMVWTRERIEKVLNDWIFEIGHHFMN